MKGGPHLAVLGMPHRALGRGDVIHITALKAGALGGERCTACAAF